MNGTYDIRLIVLVLISIMVSGCGGGGSDAAVSLKYDVQKIDTTVFRDQNAATNADENPGVIVTGRAKSDISGDIYVYILDDRGVFTEGPPANFSYGYDDHRFEVTLAINEQKNSLGVHTGRLKIRICADPECVRAYSVDNDSIEYRVTIVPKLEITLKIDGKIQEGKLNPERNLDGDPSVEVTNGTIIEMQSNVPVKWTVHRTDPYQPKLRILDKSSDTRFRAQVVDGGGTQLLYQGTYLIAKAIAPSTEFEIELALDYSVK